MSTRRSRKEGRPLPEALYEENCGLPTIIVGDLATRAGLDLPAEEYPALLQQAHAALWAAAHDWSPECGSFLAYAQAVIVSYLKIMLHDAAAAAEPEPVGYEAGSVPAAPQEDLALPDFSGLRRDPAFMGSAAARYARFEPLYRSICLLPGPYQDVMVRHLVLEQPLPQVADETGRSEELTNQIYEIARRYAERTMQGKRRRVSNKNALFS